MSQKGLRICLLLTLYGMDCLYQQINAPYPLAYFLAGLAGALTVWLLNLFRDCALVRDVQIIQTVWVGLHAFGFVLYMFYFEPDLYDHAQIFLHLIQILWIVLAHNDDANGRLYGDGAGRFRDAPTRLYRSYPPRAYQ